MKAKVTQGRIQKVLREERATPLKWVYCSFADKKFLGAVILQAHGPADASTRCWDAGTNPGGEMLLFEIHSDKVPPEKYRNRLLTREEISEFWPGSKSIREIESEKKEVAP